MTALAFLLLAADNQLYSVPCAEVWRAAAPAWSSLGLRAVSLDRPGGTAILAARLTGDDATRRTKEWTRQRQAYYERLVVDVTLTFEPKRIAEIDSCELRVDPLFNVTWNGHSMEVPGSKRLEATLIAEITRRASQPR